MASMKFRDQTKRAIPLLFFLLAATSACYVQNTDSGVCTTKYLPASSSLEDIERARERWTADLPFCGRYIASYYAPCVPGRPTDAWTAPDPHFPEGRLADPDDERDDARYSVRSKDRWVERMVTGTIAARIEREKELGSRHYHYFRNEDCQEAYARYACWVNFPRCDEFDQSLPVCQSGE